ncbi:hypothetical protein [Vibrio salinus]|uniref:hypothetical protein n=1 Tax=Vibrio salinus TaxID=2899784 RepID=UPI001E6431D7|nr:hypothetical protein [Vibrio salinus]MCE0494666.1 hypothetical protein [Vibrio salinus]
MKWFYILISLCLYLTQSSISQADTTLTITYRSPQNQDDKRKQYQIALLKLALEKTRNDYGDYKLVPSGSMNNDRALEVLKTQSRKNFFIRLSYDSEYPDYMDYVHFPVDLGIVGYRVCFISPKANHHLSPKPTLKELKQFTHVQGRGWMDVKILRYNGFNVHEINNYTGKFYAVALSRFDLFCRGINEIQNEFNQFSHIEKLIVDKRFVFFYPLPRFFYTNKNNKQAIERLTKGIMRAYHDGSLISLWEKMYSDSISYSDISHRQLFILKNPYLKDIDFDYSKFFYINREFDKEPDHK